MSKRAIILAGGLGTRLKPYTVTLPKPLVPIGSYPILEIILRQLSFFGFDHITLAVNHQADIIRAYFGTGGKWGVRIDYSLENTPLSTMGPLKLIPDLPENFLVMNGDILTDLDFSEFFAYHQKNQNLFSLSAFRRSVKSEFGVLELTPTGALTGFQEKPVLEFDVSMGIYAANRKILDYIPLGKPFGFDHLMLKLIEMGQPAIVRKFAGLWLDIGRPDDYEEATEAFEKNLDRLLPQGFCSGRNPE